MAEKLCDNSITVENISDYFSLFCGRRRAAVVVGCRALSLDVIIKRSHCASMYRMTAIVVGPLSAERPSMFFFFYYILFGCLIFLGNVIAARTYSVHAENAETEL